MEKITSRSVKMKLESDMFGGAEGETIAKAPNKQFSQFEVPNFGAMIEGFDGTVAWSKSPMELRVKTGEELAKVKRDADFYKDLHMQTVYPGLAYKGSEKVDGEEAYVLEAKPSGGGKEKLFFSAKTGLVIKMESEFEGPQGQVNASVVPQDYKVVDGIKYPHTMKMKFNSGGQAFEFTMKVVEVKHNVKVDDAKFAKPTS
jgi:hypothetical protein